MYLVVAAIACISALLIDLVVSGTSSLRDEASRQIDSAIRRAARTEVSAAYGQAETQ